MPDPTGLQEETMLTSTVDTFLGPFTVITDGEGAVLASGWTPDVDTLYALIHPSLRTAQPRPRRELGEVTRAIVAYHAGELAAIDGIPIRQYSGGSFLPLAWQALRKVEPGAPISYTELASRTGTVTASRAAASACARTAVVPCHRVIRTDGSLGGFRWGLPIKQRLLTHEAR
jgi:methylated-DNA-[protein]-cysteine S-methyltransferase